MDPFGFVALIIIVGLATAVVAIIQTRANVAAASASRPQTVVFRSDMPHLAGMLLHVECTRGVYKISLGDLTQEQYLAILAHLGIPQFEPGDDLSKIGAAQ